MQSSIMSSKADFPFGNWLLCKPIDYDVRYKINPWMDITRTPNGGRALEQWTVLHHTLIRLGAWVSYIDQGTGLPDMVFTANGGLVLGKKVVLPRFRHPERQGEEPLFKQWFLEHGYDIYMPTSGAYEGEGDSLFAGNTLFCGYGFRSDLSVYSDISTFLALSKTVPVQLIDERFYHLDTCFAPLSESLALLFPGAVSAESKAAIENEIEVITVSESDALKFVCNTVVLGKTLVMPKGAKDTIASVNAKGFDVVEVELDEFIKAGGAAKCLSLRLS